MKAIELLTVELFQALYEYLETNFPDLKGVTEVIFGWSEVRHGLAVTLTVQGEKLSLLLTEDKFTASPRLQEVMELLTGNGEFLQFFAQQSARFEREATAPKLLLQGKRYRGPL